MHNGHWNDSMDGGGSWWWMALMMVIFWGGLIVLAVALIRRPNHAVHAASAGSGAHPTAQEILAERLARGEIEADEYRSRLDALNHRTSS